MPSSLNADNGVVSGTAGLKSSADSSGVLDLQTNGTTAISISASQVVSFANQPTYTGGTANGVMFLNGSKAVTTGTALTFDGAILGVNGISVGRGAGAVATNTAVGASALAATASGGSNTGIGYLALTALTSGSDNTAVGRSSLSSNQTGSTNVAVGVQALTSNTTASYNTALGYQAGYSQTTASGNGANTFIGYVSGYGVTTGYYNTFIGQGAGYYVTTGYKNTILGAYNGNQGGLDIRTASNRIVLSDGDGNPRFYIDNTGAAFFNASAYVSFNNQGYIRTDQASSFAVQAGASTTVGFQVRTADNATTKLSMSGTGGTSLALEGAAPVSGTGITFPATQSASSNANTLDDYEEGTWTPILRGANTAGSYTLSEATASYVKIGRQVTVNCIISVSAVSAAGVGYAQITGLPFTNSQQAQGPVYFANVNLDASCMWCVVEFISGSGQTIVYFDTIRDNTSSLDTDISGFTTNSNIRFALTYFTST